MHTYARVCTDSGQPRSKPQGSPGRWAPRAGTEKCRAQALPWSEAMKASCSDVMSSVFPPEVHGSHQAGATSPEGPRLLTHHHPDASRTGRILRSSTALCVALRPPSAQREAGGPLPLLPAFLAVQLIKSVMRMQGPGLQSTCLILRADTSSGGSLWPPADRAAVRLDTPLARGPRQGRPCRDATHGTHTELPTGAAQVRGALPTAAAEVTPVWATGSSTVRALASKPHQQHFTHNKSPF